ncbi:COG1470 family protein [Chitinophaga jiangningensis]|nr:NEW3 domain-containing protein [Chitinophaga jiangningensis]
MLACLLFVIASTTSAQKGKSALTVRLINLESTTKDPFRYNATLSNGSGQTKVYELHAQLPEGWNASFRAEGSLVAGLRMDSGRTQDLSIEITTSPQTKPGKYTIPVTAVSYNDTLRAELQAVVKGSYGLELTTPTGRLSDDVTEGRKKQITLTIRNTGSLPLNSLELQTQAPTGWSATFEPSSIQRLDPGQSQDVTATLSVPDKTIAGDYVTNFTARNNDATSTATFRMTVKTSLLSGWIGVLVILLSLGIIYYLIRKYGRR